MLGDREGHAPDDLGARIGDAPLGVGPAIHAEANPLAVALGMAAGRIDHRIGDPGIPGDRQIAKIAVGAEPVIAALVGAVPVVVARPQALLVELDPLPANAAGQQAAHAAIAQRQRFLDVPVAAGGLPIPERQVGGEPR